MSAVNSRPRVKSIEAITVPDNRVSIASVIAGLAITAAATCVRRAIEHSASPTASRTVEPVGMLVPALDLRLSTERGVMQEAGAGPVDAVKSATLAALAKTALVVARVDVDVPLQQLMSARTAAEASADQRKLVQAAKASHQRVVLDALSVACEKASVESGFGRFEAIPSAFADTRRVVASDEAGRTLVSEVRANAAGGIDVSTEVVGITNGSCHAVLDRFGQALSIQGVKSDESRRKWTGEYAKRTSPVNSFGNE